MLFFETSEKQAAMINPLQTNVMISEAVLRDALTEDELHELCESTSVIKELTELGVVTEKTIVRLDKNAKFERAFKTAVLTIAREKKDKKFKKLLTLWKMERAIEADLARRYKAEATKRAKAAIAAMRSGAAKKDTINKVVAKAANNAKKQFN